MPGWEHVLTLLVSAMLLAAGMVLTVDELNLTRASIVLQRAQLARQPVAEADLDAAIAAYRLAALPRAGHTQSRLFLTQTLIGSRGGENLPRLTAQDMTALRSESLELLSKRPMPSHTWCLLAAWEARINQLSRLALNALDMCGRAVTGDAISLDTRWELSLAAWPVISSAARAHFFADLRRLTAIELEEAKGHVERLAKIAARTAPQRSEVIAEGLTTRPQLARFYASAFNEALKAASP